MKIIAVANQKGGVGKSTTVGALAYGLIKKGKKVLVVDFDPQGNFTTSVETQYDPNKTIFDCIKSSVSFKECIVNVRGVDVIPANIKLAPFEQEFSGSLRKEEILIRMLVKNSSILEKYDYLLIDSSPSLGLLTMNVLAAADELIVPLKAEIFSLEGLDNLLSTIKTIREYDINKDLKINGVLLCMVDNRRKSTQEIISAIRLMTEKFKIKLYDSQIRQSTVAPDAAKEGLTIYESNPKSPLTLDYVNFIEEFIKTQE